MTPLHSLLRLRTVVRAVLLAGVAAIALPTAAFACTGQNDLPTAQNLRVARTATLCLLNQQRAAHGLRRLHAHTALQSAAQRYAGAMVADGFFGHVSPTGTTLDERIRQGTRYLTRALRWEIGENLAWGAGERARPLEIVQAWMASPGHRANILRPAFREIGIGIAPGAPVAGVGGAVTYANEFGTRVAARS
jgi:uncharacterized protein YkwD